MTRYFLGLDWGKAKIGIALADTETCMAFAHSTVKNDEHFFDTLQNILTEHDVETVILGEPSQYAHASFVGDAARAFGREIAKRCHVDIVYVQEMFTTKMAQSNLLESGKKRNLDDQEAARLILQEWLDNRKWTRFLNREFTALQEDLKNDK